MDTQLAALCAAGLSLVPIAPIDGKPTKRPTAKGWNQPKCAINPNGYSSNADNFIGCDDYNFGIHHGSSGTLAFDIDDMAITRRIFDELTDIQLLDWLEDESRLEIKSPRPNRGKLLFKLPKGINALGVKQCKKPKPDNPKQYDVVFELRSGNGAQDVIIGEHPDYIGQRYQLIGNPAAIPDAPAVLLDMLENWEAWKPCFDSVLGVETEPPKIAPRKPQKSDDLEGKRDPIQEFNQAFVVADVLTRNGYQPAGKDRFIRPNSSSHAPAVAIMRNCKDGIERIYSHGGDCLNDGYAHDAFDCFKILECGGDQNTALAWNIDITKHNQRLYMQLKAPPMRFNLLSNDDLEALPPIQWRIKKVLPTTGIAAVFGASGSGKTFVVLDMVQAMATGKPWFGYRTKPCNVLYCALEGEGGIAGRVKAYREKHGTTAPNVRYLAEPFSLLDNGSIDDLARAIKANGQHSEVVVIDTMNRAAPGADENDSKAMGEIIAATKQLQGLIGGLVVLVHHTGKDVAKGLRGHSSLGAALDGVIEIRRDGERREVSIYKTKDGEDGLSYPFELEIIELGFDDDGDVISSCVVKPLDSIQGAIKKALPPKSSNQRVIWDALTEILRKTDTLRPVNAPDSLPQGKPCILFESAIEQTKTRLVVEQKRQTERAQNAISGLVNRGLLGFEGGYLWCK